MNVLIVKDVKVNGFLYKVEFFFSDGFVLFLAFRQIN